jgi:hypothetical protein
VSEVDADAIRADIELTRAELAETVDALHSKLDVRAQVRRRCRELVAKSATVAQRNRRPLLIVTGAAVVLLVLRRSRVSRRS